MENWFTLKEKSRTTLMIRRTWMREPPRYSNISTLQKTTSLCLIASLGLIKVSHTMCSKNSQLAVKKYLKVVKKALRAKLIVKRKTFLQRSKG